MKRVLMFLVTVSAGGCEKNLLTGLPDAAIDAPVDVFARVGCPLPAMPLAPGRHKVYLNTEGATITSDGSCDDSFTNCSNELEVSPTAVPPFLPGSATRQAFIDQIVAMTEQSLAPYSIDIVTVRPATAPYQMIVLGGDPSITGSAAGNGSQTPFDCAFEPSALDFIFDYGDATLTPAAYVTDILSDIGVMAGLPGTPTVCDCECRVDSICSTVCPTLCTFGSAEPVSTSLGSQFTCGLTVENEPAMLEAALGCR